MATIVQVDLSSAVSAVTATRTAMTASDTFTYVQGSGQKLFLWNTTASPVVITIDGTGGTTVTLPPSYGLGGAIDVSAGKTVTVPATSSVVIDLDDYAAYLQGTVALTGGTGVTAHLYV